MTEHVRADTEALVIRGADGAGASGVVVGAATDVGRLRTVNEDGYLAIAPANEYRESRATCVAMRPAACPPMPSTTTKAGAMAR